MEELYMLEDILQYRISAQISYNESLINIRNPEVKQVFTQMRDDETRAIVELQQKIERLKATSGIIKKIFPTKPRD